MDEPLDWIKEVKEGRAMVVPVGTIRLKHDFGAYTGWTQKIERRGDRAVVRVHYEYPEGPMYQKPITHNFAVQCLDTDASTESDNQDA